MRPAAVLLAMVCSGCFVRPIIASGDTADCERSCRAVADHCSDDSAKERQPQPSTCTQDLHTCVARCSDAGSGDPVARVQADAAREPISTVDGLIRGTVVNRSPGR